MEEDKKVYAYLEKINVTYIKHVHPPVFTVEEANEHWENITGMHCKNLFLRDKKGRRHYLIVLESSKQVDIKKMNKQLNERLSFASQERLLKHLGLTPGSVSPFGLINNLDNEVRLILDQDIKNADEVNFHPNVNTATLTLSNVNFMHYLNVVGNEWQFVNI